MFSHRHKKTRDDGKEDHLPSGHLSKGRIKLLGVRNFVFFSAFIGLISFTNALGQELKPPASPEVVFNEGTAAYSKSNWPEATEKMKAYVSLRPNDAKAHVNLVTLYLKQKKWGPAWAHYRKARALNPQIPGLDSLQAQLEDNRPNGSGLSGPFHRWIRPVIADLDTNLILAILLTALTSSIHLFIRYMKKRRWALEAEEAPPALPWTSWSLIGFAGLIGAIILLKFYLQTQSFGSVVADSISVVSAPTQDGFEIATLPAGIELKVLREQNSWVQVTNESGLSGWILRSSLVIYPGASL